MRGNRRGRGRDGGRKKVWGGTEGKDVRMEARKGYEEGKREKLCEGREVE